MQSQNPGGPTPQSAVVDGVTKCSIQMNGTYQSTTAIQSIVDAANSSAISFGNFQASAGSGQTIKVGFTAMKLASLISPSTVTVTTNDGQSSGSLPIDYIDTE